MMQSRTAVFFVLGLLSLPALCPGQGPDTPATASEAERFSFSVRYPATAFAGPFTGRIVVYLAKDEGKGDRIRQPRFGPNWFNPEPMFGFRAKNAPPDQGITFGASAWTAFPAPPERLKKGTYAVQAVLDRNLGGRSIGSCPGNLYSKPQRIEIDPAAERVIELVCDQLIGEKPFVETARVKELRVPSKLLSDFYGRPTTVNGAVLLPAAYAAEPDRKFPIFYSIPGFGGTHQNWSGNKLEGGGRGRGDPTLRAGEPFLFVELDPSCPGGHSVFADSANNGPWGAALTTEFIPECERRFRARGDVGARFTGGHSSGGWSSLWLQTAYPDVFGGCWSTAPDPVDFRDFQRIDAYADGENMFVDSKGLPRGLARMGGATKILYKNFSDMERPLRGEQLASFEWVFSPRGTDGEPKPLWNRDTGVIAATVAAAWKPYDIGLRLRSEWPKLAPTLDGKIHVYMGTEDTFFLEGAVKLLKRDLEALKADAVVELFPGDHGTVMTPALLKRIDEEMAAQFRKSVPVPPGRQTP